MANITGTKLFAVGEQLTSVDTNRYLMRGVKVFADATERDNAYDGVAEPDLEEGETVYLADLDTLQVYTGTSWIGVGGGADILQVQVFS